MVQRHHAEPPLHELHEVGAAFLADSARQVVEHDHVVWPPGNVLENLAVVGQVDWCADNVAVAFEQIEKSLVPAVSAHDNGDVDSPGRLGDVFGGVLPLVGGPG